MIVWVTPLRNSCIPVGRAALVGEQEGLAKIIKAPSARNLLMLGVFRKDAREPAHPRSPDHQLI